MHKLEVPGIVYVKCQLVLRIWAESTYAITLASRHPTYSAREGCFEPVAIHAWAFAAGLSPLCKQQQQVYFPRHIAGDVPAYPLCHESQSCEQRQD